MTTNFPMTSLANWSPLRAVARFDPMASFEDMFRNLAGRQHWSDVMTAPDMRIDVMEDDKAFRIKAEIPGVHKDDVNITVDGSQVTISVEMKREMAGSDAEKEIYCERYVGKTSRSLMLPGDFDDTKTEASLENGVLSLSLPKKANGSTHRIMVS